MKVHYQQEVFLSAHQYLQEEQIYNELFFYLSRKQLFFFQSLDIGL